MSFIWMPGGVRLAPARPVSEKEVQCARARLQGRHSGLDDLTLTRILSFTSRDTSLADDVCILCNSSGNRRRNTQRKGQDHRLIRLGEELVYAHRLFYELFVGPIPEDKFVLHGCPVDSNGRCVNVLHLRLGTQAENLQDMRDAGNAAVGEANGQAKLTKDDVYEILELDKQCLRQRDIAQHFGISQSQVNNIIHGKLWKHARDVEEEANPRAKRHTNKAGQSNSHAKLTDHKVRKIRHLAGRGVVQREIAKIFGISKTQVGNIVRGKAWGHVKDKVEDS